MLACPIENTASSLVSQQTPLAHKTLVFPRKTNDTLCEPDSYQKSTNPALLEPIGGNLLGPAIAPPLAQKSLSAKYKDIMVARHGETPNAYMVTEKIVSEVEPHTIYQVEAFGLTPTTKKSPISKSTRSILTPPFIRLPIQWSKQHCAGTQQANILGKNDTIFVSESDYEIPIAPTTNEHLAFYGAKLVSFGDTLQFESSAAMPLTKMSVGKNYSNDYLQQKDKGGGFYIEGHDRPHFHMPVDKEAGGFLILGKQNSKQQLVLSAFVIPYGQAIYTPPWILHNDGFLNGNLLVVYSKTDNYFTGIFKTKSNAGEVRFSVSPQ